MSIEGSLGEFRLQEILQAVAQQRRTGILTVQSETTIVAISFLAGGVVSADSLAHTVEERLGDSLVEEGLADRASVGELNRRQDAGEGRLVDLLVDDGLLSREEVLAALRRQNRALLSELLEWREGEFKFYGGDEVAYEEGIEPIAIDEFLLTSLEDGDAAGAAADEEEVIGGWPDTSGEPGEPGVAAAPEAAVEEPAARDSEGWSGPFSGPASASPGRVAAAPAVVAPPAVEPAAGLEEEAAVRPVAPRRSERRPEVTAAPAVGARAHGSAVAPLLALVLAALLVVATVISPVFAIVPLPWQQSERQAMVELQRLGHRLAVDRAAKTYFLLEGRFPDRLEELADLGLLDRGELVGPEGRRLELVAGEESYDILAGGSGESSWSEAISGNFLLDPEMRGDAGPRATSVEAPLVLLD